MTRDNIQILVDTDQVELGDSQVIEPQRVGASSNGMVATQHYCASEAGKEILARGGNAIDAAVAAALAIGVCEPAASGLGGQTMMLIHTPEPRRTFALDGSSRAPNRANAELFSEKGNRLKGHLASTVPSTLATLEYARKEYGTMSLGELLEPSIKIAKDGFAVSPLLNRLTKRELNSLKKGSAAGLYLNSKLRPHAIASNFTQPVLAKTFARLAKYGCEDFYQGLIAKKIHKDMQAHGGLINADDLAQIPYPVERKPVSCNFNGLRVITFPPPGAGRTLIEMLHIYDHIAPANQLPDSPDGAVTLAEVIRRAFLDRRDRPYDPTFYAQIDDKRMINKDYARKVAYIIKKRVKSQAQGQAQIIQNQGTKKRGIRTQGETTHISAMDKDGNVVALTQSIERVFGACAASPELGFLYNNYMSAFEYDDISHPYYMRPNAAPWASVAPTIVFQGRKPWLAIGSPGSDRIAPSILQVLLRLQSMSPLDAVSAPRLHCRINGEVSMELTRMRSDIPAALRQRGFTVKQRDPFSFYHGCVQLVMREKETFIGVADPRRDGSAAGP